MLLLSGLTCFSGLIERLVVTILLHENLKLSLIVLVILALDEGDFTMFFQPVALHDSPHKFEISVAYCCGVVAAYVLPSTSGEEFFFYFSPLFMFIPSCLHVKIALLALTLISGVVS